MIRRILRRLLHRLGYLPVKVRRGLARGAWWSIYPHSAYWRLGGNDPVIDAILRRHGTTPGSVCWDLGAHFGIYSVALARAVGPSGRVEAFEPDPVSFRRLAWHRRINRLAQLHLHPVAASSTDSEARLYQYDEFGATTSHLPYASENVEHVRYRTIRLVRLDDWCDAGRILPPAFVKIDVEGHAVQAIEGMRRTLAARLPVILLAVHNREEETGARALLAPLGYTLAPADPDRAETLARDAFGELLCLPPATVR